MNGSSQLVDEIYFHAPGYYRIDVQGQQEPGWSQRFGAMRVISTRNKDAKKITVLRGPVSDQAELAGILNTLYELHLTLIKVQYLG